MVISNIDSGEVEKKKQVSLNDICNLAHTQAEFKKSPDTVYHFYPTNENATVHTSQHLVEAALTNILHNAFKFTKHGTVTMSCEIRSDTKQAVITVSDTGPGIPFDKTGMGV